LPDIPLNASTGSLGISGHQSGVTIGSIEGSGNVFLGANDLTVGTNNISTAFSGGISNNGHHGSLAKVGLIASNDNRQHTIIGGVISRDQVQDIMDSGHAPTQPSESAIIADLPPGNYTAIVGGVNNTTSVALVEVYDFD
jgi:hypothetical protein